MDERNSSFPGAPLERQGGSEDEIERQRHWREAEEGEEEDDDREGGFPYTIPDPDGP